VGGLLTVFAGASLVDDEDAGGVRGRLGALQQDLEPAPVDGLGVPAGFREEPLQALGLLVLRPGRRLGVGQSGEGLVALGRKQQAFEVAAEAFALGTSAEEVVEAGGLLLQGTWGR